MTNKKIKNASFNLQMQAIIKDNWRFLAGICLVLSSEEIFGKAKWGKKRLNEWVDSAAEMCNTFNDYDRDGIYRHKLDELEHRHGDIITRERVESVVYANTTLKRPSEIAEIVDNVLLELLMTVNEFDSVGRERLMNGFESLTREQIDNAPAVIKDKFGIEVDDEFTDFKAIMNERKGRKDKVTYKEQKEAAKALQAFRAWSDSNNRKEVG